MDKATVLHEGDIAPDFQLRGTAAGETQQYSLDQFFEDADWLLLAFYSFDFNAVCTAMIQALRDVNFDDTAETVSIAGISGDGIHAHKQFAAQYDIEYPLLSDTAKDVGEEYGVVHELYDGLRQVHRRVVFLIDDSQTVQFLTFIDAESPEDVEFEPIAEDVEEILSG